MIFNTEFLLFIFIVCKANNCLYTGSQTQNKYFICRRKKTCKYIGLDLVERDY